MLGSLLAGRLHPARPRLHRRRTATRPCPWPTGRCCAPPSARSLYLALIALLSLGVATAVRDSAVAIGVVLGLLYLFPIVRGRRQPALAAAPGADRPDDAPGWHIQATTDLRSLPHQPMGRASACSPPGRPAALLAGGLLLCLRDA